MMFGGCAPHATRVNVPCPTEQPSRIELRPLVDGFVYAQSIRCSWGIAEQCAFTGEAYHLGMGVPRDFRRALSFFQRACTLGALDGCVMAGYMTVQVGEKAKFADVLATWEEACQKGSYSGCAMAGMTLTVDRMHLGTPRDIPRGREYLERACAARDMRACGAAAALTIEFKEASNFEAARAQLVQACRLHERETCHYLAQCEFDGTFGKADAAAAGRYFLQACNDGWGASCSAVAYLITKRTGTRDGAAERFLSAACTLGHEPACEALRDPRRPLPLP
jgi:TPR repeat protein